MSAVSSLSESKLNALGLCLSIASNLDQDSPFDFLLIDDPIQSLDAQHEGQFVQVIRRLVETEGKQVVLLSHNRGWLDQVRVGCRSLNGIFYEITSYTRDGPSFVCLPWERWERRLDVVDAILKDTHADSVRLQQAEGEIRIVVAQLASDLFLVVKGACKPAHTLNGSQIAKMLTECGVDNGLRDRLMQSIETTNDAHHAPSDYTPIPERIRLYHSWAHELGSLVNRQSSSI